MIETAQMAPPHVPRRRIAIAADGAVTGDGTPDLLGASLRYATRMASQIEPLLDLGPLQWLTTLSGTAVTARVAHVDGDLTVTAEVEERATEPVRPASAEATGAHTAVRRCLHWVRDDLDTEWCAMITWDKRVVGAILPDPKIVAVDVRAVLDDVGVRALAVLGALDESYRESAVVLEYARGSLLVIAVEGDVLVTFGNRFDAAIAAPLIERVRSVLAPHDLDLVWTWGESWTRD